MELSQRLRALADLDAASAMLRIGAMLRDQDPALADWADQAGRRLRSGLDAAKALGMDPATQAALRRSERNRLLRQAFEMIEGEGPWTRALRLSAEIETCETRVFPHWRASGGPPPEASKLRRCLWQARLSGRFPGARQLAEICR